MRTFTDEQSITGEYLTVEQRDAVTQQRIQRLQTEHGAELANLSEERRDWVLSQLPYGYTRAVAEIGNELREQQFFACYAEDIACLDEQQRNVFYDALSEKGEASAVRWLKIMVGVPTRPDDRRRKLTAQQVEYIKQRRASGESMTKLAAEFGVSKMQVSRLCRKAGDL
jgi:hypothetical protein